MRTCPNLCIENYWRRSRRERFGTRSRITTSSRIWGRPTEDN